MSFKKFVKNKKIASFLINDEYFIENILSLYPKEYYAFNKNLDKDYFFNGKYTQSDYYTYKQVQKNNADIMFLNWTAAAAVRRYVYVGHAELFLLPLNISLLLPPVLIGLIRYATRKQYKYSGIFKFDNLSLHYKYWLAYKPTRKKFRLGARRYYSPIIAKEDFFRKLEGITYCLLRWHERLDSMSKDEDLDILVADADVDKFLAVLDQNIGTLPIGLYSESGNVNINNDRISYYPPRLAEEILANIIKGPENVKIPNPEYALLSFIYHLLYHKGYQSGLKSEFGNPYTTKKYREYLELKSKAAGINIPETMEKLADYLKSRNWIPSNDMLNRYAISNSWVKDYYISSKSDKFPPGLTVFIIRELGDKDDIVNEILNSIKNRGFIILNNGRINNNNKMFIAKNIRGGNWCENQVSRISGLPARYIIAFDPAPIIPDKKFNLSNPVLDNQRIEVKSDLRKKVNVYLPEHEKTNIIHTSDNSEEALDYIGVILTDEERKYFEDYLFANFKSKK